VGRKSAWKVQVLGCTGNTFLILLLCDGTKVVDVLQDVGRVEDAFQNQETAVSGEWLVVNEWRCGHGAW
jgi:hypothetical protein